VEQAGQNKGCRHLQHDQDRQIFVIIIVDS